MPNKLLVSIGPDTVLPGKFWWNVKDISSREIICERRGFNTLEEARTSLEGFRDWVKTTNLDLFKTDLVSSDVMVNR